jgi:hypothetical protein
MKTVLAIPDKPLTGQDGARGGWGRSGPLVVLLCVIYIAECAWFIRSQSLTYDEPVHIAAGQDAWRHNRFQMWNDHPPLARLWCSLPVLSQRWRLHVYGLPDGFRVDEIRPDPQALAGRARAMNVLFALAYSALQPGDNRWSSYSLRIRYRNLTVAMAAASSLGDYRRIRRSPGIASTL